MKITEVRLGRISVPLRTPFKTALRTVSSVEDVIVEIHTDCGRIGYGEAPPTGPITGDTTVAFDNLIQYSFGADTTTNKLVIKGGTFTEANKADIEACLADGYKVIGEDGNWVVVKD